jgi:hypothetical protein
LITSSFTQQPTLTFKAELTVYLRSFQIQRRILRKPGGEALKQIVLAVL